MHPQIKSSFLVERMFFAMRLKPQIPHLYFLHTAMLNFKGKANGRVFLREVNVVFALHHTRFAIDAAQLLHGCSDAHALA